MSTAPNNSEPVRQDPVLAPDGAVAAQAEAGAAGPAASVDPASPPVEGSGPQPPGLAAAETPAPAPVAAADDPLQQQLQALSDVVLDSADIANRSSKAALNAGKELQLATDAFRDMHQKGIKQAKILFAVTSGVLVLALVFFLVMGGRMISRINQLDTMLLAVGKRAVELSTGLQTLDSVNSHLSDLMAKQDGLVSASTQLEARIGESLAQSQALVGQVPAETAKQVAATSDNLAKQVEAINSRLKAQAAAVQSLGGQVAAMKGSVGNVGKLNQDVEALVTLQRERYLETLQRNNAVAAKERSVQFPRVDPAGEKK